MWWTPLNDRGREERTLELLLRIGVAGCFIGHGAFGVIGKEAWLPYFSVVGIGQELAWTLMPIVGWIDILVGVVSLVSPRPFVLGYAAFWTVWTALLRPLAGESFFETLERAGNYGIPIALLVLAATRLEWSRAWLRPLAVDRLTRERRRQLHLVLRATTATLLLGHGGLALFGKPLLADHLAAVGLPAGALPAVGAAEVALAGLVAVRPLPGIVLFVLGWKLATEALFLVAGSPFWEFVERAGSYVAPLALWVTVRTPAPLATTAARASSGAFLAVVGLLGLTGLADARPTLIEAAGPPGPAGRGQATLLASLQQGGYVLACRHAITDGSRGDARRVDLDDPSTQRVLSEEGRAQARGLGEELRRLRIPVGEVYASPYARTRDTAELGFGRSEPSDALVYGNRAIQRRERRRLLTAPPADGTNRMLVSHQGVLYRMLPQVRRGSLAEGDCAVVHPGSGGTFEVVAQAAPGGWAGLADDSAPADPTTVGRVAGTQELSVEDVIAEVRRGGTTLVCRHAITDSTREIEPVDYDDPSTQRLLSPEGERQSVVMGRAIDRLKIEVTELVASPMRRAYRTAELMLGRPAAIEAIWHTNGGSYGGVALEERRRTLAAPVERGNRLIVSHIGTISSVLPSAEDRLGEGDCVVTRPAGSSHSVVGFVPWEAWERVAAAGR